MDNQFVLQPLEVGRFPAFPLNRFLLNGEPDKSVEAPCISWFARSTSSDLAILVDTGPAEPTEETSKFHLPLEVGEKRKVHNALKSHGIDPEEITHVVFTHLHFDHCAYAQHLPNAKILVQKSELQYAVAPQKAHLGGYEASRPNVIPSWMRSFDRIVPIEGDISVAPGFQILLLPGHTYGSSGVVFNTAQGTCAVAGDLINQVENWEGDNGRHIPPAANIGIDQCHESFKRLEKEADTILASHDYRMFDKTRY